MLIFSTRFQYILLMAVQLPAGVDPPLGSSFISNKIKYLQEISSTESDFSQGGYIASIDKRAGVSKQNNCGAIIFFKIMQEGHNEVITDRPINPASSCQLPQLNPQVTNEPSKPIYTDLRINADDQSSCKVAAYWAIIVAAILLVSILSQLARKESTIVVPHAILDKNQKQVLKGTALEGCASHIIKSNAELVCASSPSSVAIGQLVVNLEPLNQFVVFYLNVSLNGSRQRFDQQIYFKLYQVQRQVNSNGSTIFEVSKVLKQEQIRLNSDYSGQQYFYIDYTNDMTSQVQFYWQIEFKLSSKLNDYNYSLESFVINPQYSIFCITLRIAFILLSILFLILTYRRFLKIPSNRLTPQYKAIVLLSAATIIFNDPLYLATVFSPNALTAFVSTFFLWNFITYLFVIWVFFLKRILEQEGRLLTDLITCPNLSIAGIFYLINLIFRASFAMEQASNRPFTDPKYVDNKFISFFFVLSTLTMLGGICYALSLYCQLWQRRQALLWRNKLFTNISFFFFVVVFLIFLRGGFNVFQYSASTVMLTFTFTNIYSFFLQFMYMPTSNQAFELQNNEKESDFQGYDQTDISIELDNEGYDRFYDYGATKLSEEEEKVAKSYLGQNLQVKGSKIVPQTIQTIQQKEKIVKFPVQQQKRQQEEQGKSIKQDQRQQSQSIQEEGTMDCPQEKEVAHEEEHVPAEKQQNQEGEEEQWQQGEQIEQREGQ